MKKEILRILFYFKNSLTIFHKKLPNNFKNGFFT